MDFLLGGHDPFGFLEVDDDVARFDSADGSADDLADPVGELLLHVLLFRLAELLHDRLAGGLGGDAAEVARSDLPLDLFAELHVGETFAGPGDHQLVAGRIFLDHFQRRPRLDLPGDRVDLHFQFAGRVDAFARRGQDRAFQRLDQAVAADSAFLLDIFENRK